MCSKHMALLNIDSGCEGMFTCASAMTDVYWWWLEKCIRQLNWQKTLDCSHTGEYCSITCRLEEHPASICVWVCATTKWFASCHNEKSYKSEKWYCIFIEANTQRNYEIELIISRLCSPVSRALGRITLEYFPRIFAHNSFQLMNNVESYLSSCLELLIRLIISI